MRNPVARTAYSPANAGDAAKIIRRSLRDKALPITSDAVLL
jgi:hypothetical protein